MKKYVAVSVILLILSIFLITTSNANFIVGMSIKANSETIKVGDEETLTLSLNEKIIAANFEITYDSSIFTLVGSETNNLSVAKKSGSIACIYADISGTGTKELRIKFKAQKETTTAAKFTIENAKFRADGQETSYTGTQIAGINKALEVNVLKETEPSKDNISNKDTPTPIPSTDTTNKDTKKTATDKTKAGTIQDQTVVSTGKLPNTGVKETTGYILMAYAILIIISAIFKYKEMSLAKLFKSGGVMVIVLTIFAGTFYTTKVYATENVEIRYNNNLLNEKKTLGVMINKTNTNKKITKAELSAIDKNVKTVLDKAGNIKADTDLIKTGDKITIEDEEYIIILYGDANGDGIVGDTDDIMVIIKDYLGEEVLPKNEYKVAANLANLDEVLDTDDLMQMINNYLGKLSGNIVTNLPDSTITIKPTEPDKPEIPSTGQKLIDVVKVGEYVKYPVEYKTAKGVEWLPESPNNPGWRVFEINKSNGVIKLVSASTCFTINLESYNDYSALCTELNNNFRKFTSNNDKQYGANAYLNSNYATSTKAFNYNDIEQYLGIKLDNTLAQLGTYKTDDILNIKQMYGLWKAESDNWQEEYIWGVNFNDQRGIYIMRSFPFGVRTVVELKTNLITNGGNGTENNPYKLK